MTALVDRALALNPNYARGWHVSGVLRMEAGQPDIAISHVEISLRLSPRARVGTSLTIMRMYHFFANPVATSELSRAPRRIRSGPALGRVYSASEPSTQRNDRTYCASP